MKKKNLKSLKLNKKSISNFQVKGGLPPQSLDYSNCLLCEPLVFHTFDCNPFEPLTGETYFGGICSYCERG